MMTHYETVEVTVDEAVGTITLNRPQKLNSLSTQLRKDLSDALDELAVGTRVRVVRLRGSGRMFSAGYDLEGSYGLAQNTDGTLPAEHRESEISRDVRALRDTAEWLRKIRRFPKPLIAQIHGMCLSGGMDLIGACDIIIGARDTRIGHPAGRGMGIPPTLGLMPMKIGMHRTKHMLFTGDTIDAETAVQWGLINEVVDGDGLDTYVEAYCSRIAQQPFESLLLHKTITNRWFELMGMDSAIDAGVELDAISHLSQFSIEWWRRASTEGVKAALRWRDAPFVQQTEE